MRKENKENVIKRLFGHTRYALKTFWRWIKRAFWGGKDELSSLGEEEIEENKIVATLGRWVKRAVW